VAGRTCVRHGRGYRTPVLSDQTLHLLRQGYPWGARLRDGSVAVPTRLLGRRAVVVGGPEGVRRFYDPRLRRRGAFPPPLKVVLFGRGGVQGLDGTAHHHRKALFVRVLGDASVADLARRAEREWAAAADDWSGRGTVVLFDEAVRVLAAAVVPWAGVPASAEEVVRRGRQLAAVVDGFGTPGRPFLRAARARWQLDRWARGLVHRSRAGLVPLERGTALAAVAEARDAAGRPLAERVAAVELLNVLRPTVAVAWLVAFAGKALAEHPDWRQRIAGSDVAARDAFAQEVRRLSPFAPVLAARARRGQDVLGVHVRRGGLVVLDLHGTTHDPVSWPDPDRFDPGRFLAGPVDPDALVPQGGGDVATGHRCPGEGVVLTLLAGAVDALAKLEWTAPPQDLGFDPSRMPTRPRSGVVLAVADPAPRAQSPTPA
jgi:fatty-acid peroxygenase